MYFEQVIVDLGLVLLHSLVCFCYKIEAFVLKISASHRCCFRIALVLLNTYSKRGISEKCHVLSNNNYGLGSDNGSCNRYVNLQLHNFLKKLHVFTKKKKKKRNLAIQTIKLRPTSHLQIV